MKKHFVGLKTIVACLISFIIMVEPLYYAMPVFASDVMLHAEVDELKDGSEIGESTDAQNMEKSELLEMNDNEIVYGEIIKVDLGSIVTINEDRTNLPAVSTYAVSQFAYPYKNQLDELAVVIYNQLHQINPNNLVESYFGGSMEVTIPLDLSGSDFPVSMATAVDASEDGDYEAILSHAALEAFWAYQYDHLNDCFWWDQVTCDYQKASASDKVWFESITVGVEINKNTYNYYKRVGIANCIDRAKEITEKIAADAKKASDSVVGQLKYVHDEIAKNVSYAPTDIDNEIYHNSFGGFGLNDDGYTVCEGYAKAFKAVCDELGISCVLVVGHVGSESHMWNAVMVDGKWYAMDITWDDDDEKIGYKFFLVGSNTVTLGMKFSEHHTEAAVDMFLNPILSEESYSYNCSDEEDIIFWEYTESGSGTLSLTKYNGSKTNVTIPSAINGKTVTALEKPLFSDQWRILKSVTIPETVTTIGASAFAGNTALTSIYIPKSMKKIEAYAFSGCSALTDIYYSGTAYDWTFIDIGDNGNECLRNATLHYKESEVGEPQASPEGFIYTIDSDNKATIIEYIGKSGAITIPSELDGKSVVAIGENAFKGKNLITSVTISEGVTLIGNSAFDGCGALVNVSLPEGMITIGKDAFAACSNLPEIDIPGSVKSIGEGAFRYCGNLERIEIPYGVESIESNMFYNDTSLVEVVLPDSITILQWAAFQKCSSLSSITIPGSVTEIGSSVFSGCSSLGSIVIPDSVNSMNSEVFYGCSSLSSVTLSANLNTLGSGIFRGCVSLNSITIPDNIKSIKSDAFYNCSKLSSISIPLYVTYIEDKAFGNCSELASIYILNSEVRFGVNVFSGVNSECTIYGYKNSSAQTYAADNNINFAEYGDDAYDDFVFDKDTGIISSYTGTDQDVVVPSTIYGAPVKMIKSSAFEQNNTITSVTIQDGVTSIGEFAFLGCKNLKYVRIPGTVTGIGQGAFENCISLEAVIIPESVTKIERLTFSECSGLKSVKIPSTVTDIDDYAFDFCDGLTEIVLPNNLTHIGDCAFGMCSKLSNIIIPDSVTSIGQGAFVECAIENIIVPEGIQSIAASTFSRCDSLKNVKLPTTITSIGPNAFDFCTSLRNVEIPENVESIGDYVFFNCFGLTKITFPRSLTVIGRSVFSECQLTDVFYLGTKSEWDLINIGEMNESLNDARLHCTDFDESENKFVVTFESNGGTRQGLQFILKGGRVEQLPPPQKEGYIFAGWYQSESCDGEKWDFDIGVEADMTLYAKWIQETGNTDTKYTVSFETNGGSAIESQIISKGEKAVEPEAPQKDGYIFDGWYQSENCTGEEWDFDTLIETDITLYAKWIQDTENTDTKYTVSFETNGGSTVELQIISRGGKAVEPEAPQKDGYVFGGWYQSENCTGEVWNFDTLIETDITLYAKWVQDTGNADTKYTVSFETNGGSAIEPQIISKGEKAVEPEAPQKDGYIFAGWYQSENCTGEVWDFDTLIEMDITLYAKWIQGTGNTDTKYTVSFETNGGSAVEPQIISRGGKAVEPKEPQKDGYIFDGWYQNENCIGEVWNFNTTVEMDIVLYAKWNRIIDYGEIEEEDKSIDKPIPDDYWIAGVCDTEYTGKEITFDDLRVYYGNRILTKNTDYTVKYKNNKNVGDASVIITGKGNYNGSKSFTFRITEPKTEGISIANATVKNWTASQVYSGGALVEAAVLSISGTTLSEGIDYTVTYKNNLNVGTATVLYRGIGTYSGTLQKTFKITALNIAGGNILKSECTKSVPIAKAGAKPRVIVKHNGKILKEGKDYTLIFKNNKKPGTASYTINGKGNFKGSMKGESYQVVEQNISGLTVSVPDVAYRNKAKIYKAKPTVYDLDGKALKAGTDYSKAYVYTYENAVTINGKVITGGTVVSDQDIIPVGTVIRVTVKGMKHYGKDNGEACGLFRIIDAAKSITKATVKITEKVYYTGKPVALDKNKISVTVKGIPLSVNDFEIVSYKNNIKKGTATVLLHGTGAYGGFKTVKFKIHAKPLK